MWYVSEDGGDSWQKLQKEFGEVRSVALLPKINDGRETMRLKNKVAFISGGARGLGAAMATLFAGGRGQSGHWRRAGRRRASDRDRN